MTVETTFTANIHTYTNQNTTSFTDFSVLNRQ